MALASDVADGMRETSDASLRDFDIASFLERGDLYADIASRGVGDLTEIGEIGALQAVEGYHDLQSQLAMEQGVDDGKLKWTHITCNFFGHIGGTGVPE